MTTLVTQSMAKVWRRCQMKYDYKYVQEIERKKPVLQLIRGTMIGKCIDALALRRINASAPHWVDSLGQYLTLYKRLFDEEKEYYGDIIGDVTNIIRRYEKVYEKDGLTYQLGKDKKPYELKIQVDLGNGIIYEGHMDKLPIDKQGRTWVMDHKSHKTMPDEDARFSDLQLVFYNWGAPLSGYPKPSGVLWDYVRTKPPAIPEALKNGELTRRKNIDTDYETYSNAIFQAKLDPKDYKEILDNLKVEGYSNFYKRVFLPNPNKDMVENVVSDLKLTANEIKHLGGVSKVRNMTRDCKSCEYYSLCQSELRGLDSDFIRKTEYRSTNGGFNGDPSKEEE